MIMCNPEGEWLNRYGTLLNLWGAQLGLPDPKASLFWDSYHLAVAHIESMPLKPKVCSKILEGLGWQMRVVDISADHGVYIQVGVNFTEHRYMQFERFQRRMTAWLQKSLSEAEVAVRSYMKSLSEAEWQQTLSED